MPVFFSTCVSPFLTAVLIFLLVPPVVKLPSHCSQLCLSTGRKKQAFFSRNISCSNLACLPFLLALELSPLIQKCIHTVSYYSFLPWHFCRNPGIHLGEDLLIQIVNPVGPLKTLPHKDRTTYNTGTGGEYLVHNYPHYLWHQYLGRTGCSH